MNNTSYDGVLVDLTSSFIQNNEKKNFYFIHLMGSHNEFSKRYPKSFAQYHPEDYKDKPLRQRELLANYDNSVLYNDWVVYELMNLFKDKEALVIYLPDHGIDIFEGSASHIGHALPSNPRSVLASKQIPLMFFTSPSYQKRHDKTLKMIRLNIDNFYCTDNLLYTVMDILGIKFKDNEEVSHHTIFQNRSVE